MKRFTRAISAIALVVGLGGGAAAFALASGPLTTSDETPTSAVEQPASKPSHEPPVVKFRPCPAPTHREGKACIEDVVETVLMAPEPSSDGREHSKQRRADEDRTATKHKDRDQQHSDEDDDSDAHESEDEDHEDEPEHEDD